MHALGVFLAGLVCTLCSQWLGCDGIWRGCSVCIFFCILWGMASQRTGSSGPHWMFSGSSVVPAGCLSLYSFQTSDSFGVVRVPYRVDTLSGGRPCVPGISLQQTQSSGFLRKPRDLRDYIMTTCLYPRTGFRSGWHLGPSFCSQIGRYSWGVGTGVLASSCP